jgi:phytoene dehydrogenase-like protein
MGLTNSSTNGKRKAKAKIRRLEMPDKTYDAVIIGGGNKALVLGMYLAKFGGMNVALFEARNELGGGWESVENTAPGFIADVHSHFHQALLWHLPTEWDIPEFIEYGGKDVCTSIVGNMSPFIEDQMATGYYSIVGDPTGEKSAALMSRYSERDAETFMRWREAWQYVKEYFLQSLCTVPAPPPGGPEGVLMGMVMDPRCGLDPQYMAMTGRRACQTLFEAVENQITPLRSIYSAGISPEKPGLGLLAVTYGIGLFADYPGYIKGGTHNATHAAQRVIKENGGEYFTRSEVEKVIIENDTAKGIRLTDGTEIGASKFVASTIAPQQVLEIIGPERFSPVVCRKIATLIRDMSLINWYWYALHERPHYTASDVMGLPELDTSMWTVPGSRDIMRLAKEIAWRCTLDTPPRFPDGMMNLAVIQPYGDETRAPQGKYTLLIEQFDIAANTRDERWWLEHQKYMAREMIEELHKYAPNITWDTVIGWEPASPYTITRLKNMAPEGNWHIIDWDFSQTGSMRPIPEWAGYRIPGLNNFYCTGGGWHGSLGANDAPGYNCYKVIAEDLGLRKVWEEKGRPY